MNLAKENGKNWSEREQNYYTNNSIKVWQKNTYFATARIGQQLFSATPTIR